MKVHNYKNHYNTLGFGIKDELGTWTLGAPPTNSDIKKSYRKLSMKYHPDVTKEEDAAIFWEEILEAYKVLSDETFRLEYDTKSKFGSDYDFKNDLYDFEFSNESDAISAINNKYKNFDPRSVTDVGVEIDEFQENIEYERWVTCKTCDGNGFDPNAETYDCEMCEENGLDENCHFCHGLGIMSFVKCPKCTGDRLEMKMERIKVTEDMFEDGECFLRFKGSNDKFEVGKVGHLYIKIKENESSN
jgi:molecular chaperone DnaJ